MSGWLITGLIIILALWGVALYNSLVTLRQRNRQAFADIDTPADLSRYAVTFQTPCLPSRPPPPVH